VIVATNLWGISWNFKHWRIHKRDSCK